VHNNSNTVQLLCITAVFDADYIFGKETGNRPVKSQGVSLESRWGNIIRNSKRSHCKTHESGNKITRTFREFYDLGDQRHYFKRMACSPCPLSKAKPKNIFYNSSIIPRKKIIFLAYNIITAVLNNVYQYNSLLVYSLIVFFNDTVKCVIMLFIVNI